jgi:uncharacterized protein (DUF362 family)
VLKGALSIPLFPLTHLFAAERRQFDSFLSKTVDTATIIEAYHPDATEGASVNAEIVQLMVDETMKALTGKENPGEAWSSVFPGLGGDSIISLKVNSISASPSHLTVHREVVNAVTAGLQKMEVDDAPFPPEHITIWDMHEHHLLNAGFEINTSGTGVQCMAADTPGVGYDYSHPIEVSGQTLYPCTILSTGCDYLINIGLIKDHNIAGGTFTLKNNYGSIDAPWRIHANNGDPHIALLNNDPLFGEKTVLCMLDSLFGVYSGGPMQYPQVIYNTIHCTFDRVAIDACGRDILNRTRVDKGYSEINASYIETAESLGMGTTEYEIDRITPTGIDGAGDSKDRNGGAPRLNRNDPVLYQNSPNPFNPRTSLRFYLPGNSGAHRRVRISIFDGNGRKVRTLAHRSFPSGTHNVSWDGRNDAGRKSASGVYIALLETMGRRSTVSMVLTR